MKHLINLIIILFAVLGTQKGNAIITFTADGLEYEMLSAADLTASLIGADSAVSHIEVMPTVKYMGHDFKITRIGLATPPKVPYSVTLLTNVTFGTYESNKWGEMLTSFYIPDSVNIKGMHNISGCSFHNCKNLEYCTLPIMLDQNYYNKTDSTDQYAYFCPLEMGLFENCQKLEYVKLPFNITSLGKNMFRNTGLKEIDLPEGLSEIKDGCFAGSKLEKIELPPRLTTIGDSAFTDCNLSELELPANVGRVGSSAFRGNKLKQFDTNNAYIGDYALVDNEIETLIVDNTPWSRPGYGYVPFQGCDKLNYYEMKGPYADGLSAFEYYYSHIHRADRLKCVIIEDGDSIYYQTIQLNNDLIEMRYCGIRFQNDVGLDSLIVCYPFTSFNLQYYYIGKEIIHGNFYKAYQDFPLYPNSSKVNYTYGNKCRVLEIGGTKRTWTDNDVLADTVILGTNVNKCTATGKANFNVLICRGASPAKVYGKFSDESLIYATVIVPRGALEAYQNADGWKSFWNLKEGETGNLETIRDQETDQLQFLVKDGKIELPNLPDDALAAIYNVLGQKIWEGAPSLMPQLTPNIYILRALGRTVKLRVQ